MSRGMYSAHLFLSGLILAFLISFPQAHAEDSQKSFSEFLSVHADKFAQAGDKPSAAKFLKFRSMIAKTRSEYKFLKPACDRDINSKECRDSRRRFQRLERELLADPYAKYIEQTSARGLTLKECLYAAMVTCSLLGGPSPEKQGLNATSSLAGRSHNEYNFELPPENAATIGAGAQ